MRLTREGDELRMATSSHSWSPPWLCHPFLVRSQNPAPQTHNVDSQATHSKIYGVTGQSYQLATPKDLSGMVLKTSER